jgi:hypothetical protein
MKKMTIHRSWNKLQIITERKATLSPHKNKNAAKNINCIDGKSLSFL